MENIPEFNPKPVTDPLPTPESVDDMIEKKYLIEIERAEAKKISRREEYDKMYKRLCAEFIYKLPEGKRKSITIVVCGNYNSRPSTYQLLAIERFVSELRHKRYAVFHRPVMQYAVGPGVPDFSCGNYSHYEVVIEL